jgi:tetratricopeptide (TPR) repeat protein
MFRLRNAVAFALVLFSTPAAFAQGIDKEQAKGRDLATSALDLYQKEKYADALAKFQDAEKLYPTAQVLRMEGYTLIALKRHLEAIDVLERALKTDFKPLLPADAEDTEDQLKEAKKKIATLRVESAVANATLQLDDGERRPLPLTVRLTPGAHRFVVEAPGHDAVDVSRDVGAGESTVELSPTLKKVEPPPPPKAPPPKPSYDGFLVHQLGLGATLAGVGLAASGTALGLGLYGLQLESAVQTNIDAHNANYDPGCTRFTDRCAIDTALINRDGARAAQYRNVALVTGIAGAGLTVLGGLFVGIAKDGPFASAKAAPTPGEKDASAGHALACGVTGLGAECRGSF